MSSIVYSEHNGSTVCVFSSDALNVTRSREVRVSDPDTRNWLCSARHNYSAHCHFFTDNFLRAVEQRPLLLQGHHSGLHVLLLSEILRPSGIRRRRGKETLLIAVTGRRQIINPFKTSHSQTRLTPTNSTNS